MSRSEIHVGTLYRVVLARLGPTDDDVLDLAHQDLDTGVKTRGDGFVKDILEALFLAHDAVKEVRPVDMRSLGKLQSPVSDSVTARQGRTGETIDHLFVEVDLHHRLDRVTYVDQLEELQERRNAGGLLVVGRLVRPHLLGCDPEARCDVSVAERLKKEDEHLLDGLFDSTSDPSRIEVERLDPLEGFSVRLDELESNVERDEKLEGLEGLRFRAKFWC